MRAYAVVFVRHREPRKIKNSPFPTMMLRKPNLVLKKSTANVVITKITPKNLRNVRISK